MNQTAFLYHEDYLKHNAGMWHPESPERLSSIVNHLHEIDLLSQLVLIEPLVADIHWIAQVHTPEYIAAVQRACQSGMTNFDSDTGICAESYDIALLAVGGVLEVVDAIMSGKIENAFCAIRPPGHHAEANRAMGFCLFNNIAIAATYIQQQHQLQKVLIIDWDVHHGNGTQNSFYADPTVFYFSVHQWPLYPGTGLRQETGNGAGQGCTLNVPLSPGAGDDVYIRVFQEELLPAAKNFQPDFILISAGFDAHEADPLAGMKVTEKGYAELTKIVKAIASESCDGRIISLLEGGYNLDALAKSVACHIRILAGIE